MSTDAYMHRNITHTNDGTYEVMNGERMRNNDRDEYVAWHVGGQRELGEDSISRRDDALGLF